MIDRYTKTVLTLIALSLGIIAARGVISSVHAEDDRAPLKVQLCDTAGQCALLVRADQNDQWSVGLQVVPLSHK